MSVTLSSLNRGTVRFDSFSNYSNSIGFMLQRSVRWLRADNLTSNSKMQYIFRRTTAVVMAALLALSLVGVPVLVLAAKEWMQQGTGSVMMNGKDSKHEIDKINEIFDALIESKLVGGVGKHPSPVKKLIRKIQPLLDKFPAHTEFILAKWINSNQIPFQGIPGITWNQIYRMRKLLTHVAIGVQRGLSDEWLELEGRNVDEIIKWFPNVKTLGLGGVKSILSLPQSIQRVEFASCKEMTMLPKLPKGLRSLWIIHCKSLKSLPELPETLEILKLINLPTLESLSVFPSNLKRIYFSDLKQLNKLPNLPDKMEELTLWNMKNLEKIPGLPKSLKKLTLWELPKLNGLIDIPKGIKKVVINKTPGVKKPQGLSEECRIHYLNL